MPRKAINAGGAAAVGPYSHAVEAAGMLYLSGQTPLDPGTGRLVEGSMAAQTLQCLKNLLNVLQAAGLDFSDVVESRIYLIDMADFKAVNEIYAEHFEKPYPARTTIGCASLPLGARIEIGMIAKLR